LRFSDFSQLSEDDIKLYEGARMFEVRSQKTDQRVSIPIHPIVEAIMASRNGHLPPFQSDGVMNRNLKVLGRMAGLSEGVEIERTEGGIRRATLKPKYDIIRTHTARRSFCTNAYLKGLDTLDIMAISGHKTESSFLKYIKVTREQRAKRIASHAFFQS
jgi:integrase